MTKEEFRSLSQGDIIYAPGNGFGVIHCTFMTGSAQEYKSYADIKLKNGMIIHSFAEEHADTIEKS